MSETIIPLRCLGSDTGSFPGLACLEPTVLEYPAETPDYELEDVPAKELRAIRNLGPDLYRSFESELHDILGEPLIAVFRTTWSPTRRYKSDVIVLGHGYRSSEIFSWLKGNADDYPGQIFGFIEEEDHIHVIHDCPWSNRSCRCSWTQHPGIRDGLKKSLRRPQFIRELDFVSWAYILLYFFVCKREGRIRSLDCRKN
ncbi:hypothetical protein AVEN_274499-1 [Araneus ventricosus]|uniref:Uncharacterized protein n=1 Tax=Araneus ventricosus TaxID=182803 RepID=A0A4Y2V440_ARAVE|nr:hypothetical protein AVEN_274499-1 [Araneus ventricosus]